MRRARIVAAVAGIIAVLSSIAIPFLPVSVDATTVSWPQPGTRSVVAPLIGYAPLKYTATVPCSTIDSLDDGVVISTVPATAPDAERFGLVARASSGRLDVVLRDIPALDVGRETLTGADCALTVESTSTATTIGLRGTDVTPVSLAGDHRPQVTGVFTDLTDLTASGLNVTIDVDSRFASSPTLVKVLVMLVAVLATIVALIAVHRADSRDGRRTRRFLPQRWWRFSAVDAVVIPTLLVWHFIGATTSDDGYQLGMARMSLESGDMANYFRYWGVPETPFGTPYYDIFGLLASITTASPFVRLPALLAGIVAWLVISREVAPRLGVAVGRSRVALWTGAFVFLAAWLPFNNGLRPEPVVAAGVLLTWCSM